WVDSSFARCSFFFFSSRRRHTRSKRDWSSDVCSSDLSAVNSSRVFSLGFVMGGRSFLPVGEIKSSRFLYENSCSRFNIFSYLRYLWHYLNGTTVPTTRPIKYTMPM